LNAQRSRSVSSGGSKTRGQAWWAGLDNDQRAAAVKRWQAEKAAQRETNPTWEWCEASARLDLAEERHCFMSDIPAADVAAHMRQRYPQCVPLLDRRATRRGQRRAA
jgi:hypothetical protein